MNKQKRVIIAGIIAVAVTTASTFAYFTSKAQINDGNKGQVSLDITNGKVKISAKPGQTEAAATWSYDVARNSSNGYGSQGVFTVLDRQYSSISNYEDINCSPDVDLNGVTDGKGWTGDRAAIGTAVTGAIANARPGDAFVMGNAVKGGSKDGADTGLAVTNESNLTTKVKLNMKDGAYNVYQKLNSAGWKLYIEGKEVTATSENELKDALKNALNNIDSFNPGQTRNYDIRIELPLEAGNEYQGTAAGNITGFDLNSMFEIVATQENNNGWNEDGK